LFRVAKGKNIKYAFSEAERDKLVDELVKIKEEKAKAKKRESVKKLRKRQRLSTVKRRS
jgi:hypothetical protein